MNQRIPGAIHFDLNDICDHDSEYPFMLPSQNQFNQQMHELDIRPDDIIVVYDYNRPMPISPRASWMLRAFGAE
mgnify:CR=1 FL=1